MSVAPAESGSLLGAARPAARPEELPRRLSLVSTIAVMVGLIVGSGVFRAPSSVAGAAGPGGPLPLPWGVGGPGGVRVRRRVARARAQVLPPRGGGRPPRANV